MGQGERCQKCKTRDLFVYSVVRNQVFCLPCYQNEKQERMFIVGSMKDVEDIDPPLGWNSPFEEGLMETAWRVLIPDSIWDS